MKEFIRRRRTYPSIRLADLSVVVPISLIGTKTDAVIVCLGKTCPPFAWWACHGVVPMFRFYRNRNEAGAALDRKEVKENINLAKQSQSKEQ